MLRMSEQGSSAVIDAPYLDDDCGGVGAAEGAAGGGRGCDGGHDMLRRLLPALVVAAPVEFESRS
jgi:hypothetical protein